MIDVTSFLLRWLYLSNLVRDIAEIQTLPYLPMGAQNDNPQEAMNNPIYASPVLYPPDRQAYMGGTDQAGSVFTQTAELHSQPPPHEQQIPHPPLHNSEEKWQYDYLREIKSYPAGIHRLNVLDALRLNVIQQLAQHLRKTDNILKKYSSYCHRKDILSKQGLENDSYSDADSEILKIFEQANLLNDEEAVVEISEEGANVLVDSYGASGSAYKEKLQQNDTPPSEEELNAAYVSMSKFRDYLPQLVSAILSSPGALSPQQALLDPVQKFRKLLLTRCLQDPDWGIELCWLLEAEVGRGWKTIFDYRQQTGSRLILVSPAEIAHVVAKIGIEKKKAFELLQNAEQATAYGDVGFQNIDPDLEPCPAWLPSSLRKRRCSHFGDTMHFIDRLTKISLDLRRVPAIQRQQVLLNYMEDMNRRLRRRMATRGDVSLDVEFYPGFEGGFDISDISADMIKYSVHFPLEPKRVTWPGGGIYNTAKFGSAAERSRAGAMRVLNIVTSECRLLSSRERCPYLVHLEVAETGMEGSDARLYASGGRGLGTTIGESLSMKSISKNLDAEVEDTQTVGEAFPLYKIPPELLVKLTPSIECKDSMYDNKEAGKEFGEEEPQGGTERFPSRGGWQSDEFYSDDSFGPTSYNIVRQSQIEQLHQQIFPPKPHETPDIPYTVTTRSALLDKVFGPPWSRKCEDIRQASPFKNVKGWRLASFIMKAGEDIRKEALVMQVIARLNEWFKSDIPEMYRPKMRPYSIMCIGEGAGLLECLSDAKSVDEIKKKTDGFTTLREYFERAYGPPHAQLFQPQSGYDQAGQQDSHIGGDGSNLTFDAAQDNFLRSLVGYSLVCYILQIKDRHNANILMDREGHVMHIDFGFILGETPKMAKIPIFRERAPFKLSTEFWECLGGWSVQNGGLGVKFCKMFEKAFACASSHSEEIASLVEAAVLNLTKSPIEARRLADGIRNRLKMRGPAESQKQKTFIINLVVAALESWETTTYDWLQKNMNGYQ